MKILVTGGGGFLGGTICRQLLDRGDEVIAYQRSANADLEKLGVKVIQGSVADIEALKRASQNCDAIIHTAAKAGMWGPYDDYFQPNVVGTKNVISACHSNNIQLLVFTSSPSVTHAHSDVENGDESLPYPETYHSPYPATKALSEQMVMSANSDRLRTVSLRPHLIWGPGDNHLLPSLLKRSKSGKLKLPGLDKLIDTIYVDNAAKAHLLALDKLQSNPEIVGGKTYFLSNDEPVAQRDIINDLLKAAGQQVQFQSISPGFAAFAGKVLEAIWKLFGIKSEPPITRWSAEQLSTAHWYNITAAKQDLGYKADISTAEGLERLSKTINS